jgi:hypothetical protein
LARQNITSAQPCGRRRSEKNIASADTDSQVFADLRAHQRSLEGNLRGLKSHGTHTASHGSTLFVNRGDMSVKDVLEAS